jgi:hypothetical protein
MAACVPRTSSPSPQWVAAWCPRFAGAHAYGCANRQTSDAGPAGVITDDSRGPNTPSACLAAVYRCGVWTRSALIAPAHRDRVMDPFGAHRSCASGQSLGPLRRSSLLRIGTESWIPSARMAAAQRSGLWTPSGAQSCGAPVRDMDPFSAHCRCLFRAEYRLLRRERGCTMGVL